MSKPRNKRKTTFQKLESLYAKCNNVLKAKDEELKRMKEEKSKKKEKK